MHVVVVGCGRVGSAWPTPSRQRPHRGRDRPAGRGVPAPRTGLHRPDDRRASASTATGCVDAGIEKAGALAAVTNGDNSNILVARVARETFGVERVVARIYDPRRAAIYERLGHPHGRHRAWTTERVLRRVLPEAPRGRVGRPERHACRSSSGRSRRLGRQMLSAELESRTRAGSSALTRLGVARCRRADLVAQEGDVVHLAVVGDAIGRVDGSRRAGRRRRRTLMRVVIAGGGNVGRFIAQRPRGRPATTSRSSSNDREPSSRHRQATDEPAPAWRGSPPTPASVGTLAAAELTDADVVAAVTGDDEDNLVISLLAKQEFGVPRVVARVNNPKNEWMFNETWGVDVSVSTPHLLTALVEEAVVGRHAGAAALVRGRQGPPGRGDAGRRARRPTARRSRSSGSRATPPWWRSSATTTWSCPGATPCCAPATRCWCWSPPTPRRRSASSSSGQKAEPPH